MASKSNMKFLNHLEFNLVGGVMSESTFFFFPDGPKYVKSTTIWGCLVKRHVIPREILKITLLQQKSDSESSSVSMLMK